MNHLIDKQQRKIIKLHDLGWHVPNIAHILSMSPGAVRQTLLNQGIEPLM